ncbi:hypothetical protein ACIPVK_04010 [Paeniglutamicibacter sp. MACA_103]|uniref:hypothetical protein n=1 Tax=Paeniglutamicibacter sp. MACA_103 TaxID=3377337 RepID=UPI003895658C
MSMIVITTNPEEEQRRAAILREVLATHPGTIAKALIMRIGENSSYYLMIVFSITYLTVHVKVGYSTVLLILFLANIVQFIAMLFGGWLSDRIGRKGAIGVGYAGLFVWVALFSQH